MPPPSSSPPPRRKLPQPVENSQRTQRRFAPEPVQTSSRSNRPPQNQEQSAVHPSTGPRPLKLTATTTLVNKEQANPHNKASDPPTDVTSPLRRKLPQPIDSSTSSTKSRSKFAPQLVETTSRQRKRGDTLPAVLDTDKTEHSPDDPVYIPRHPRLPRPTALPIPPVNSPTVSSDHVPQLPESRFSYASLSQQATLDKPDRRHSFRVPELPSIPSQTEESEDSGDSTCSSFSTTPSADPDETEWIKNKKNHDGSRAGYLLSLAAQAAEKQLREQAMAAYPNERSHEPVDHFAVDREDDSDKEGEGVGLLSRSATYPAPGGSGSTGPSSRRESHAGWDIAEVRKHKETLERQRKVCQENDHATNVRRQRSMKDATKEHHHERQHGHHHERPHEHHHNKRNSSRPHNQNVLGQLGGQQKDDQMNPMHKAASPPMAGQNLKFARCQTPRQTRLDVGQYPGAPSHLNAPRSREHSGLWTPQGDASRQSSKNGLWMGVCALSAQKPHDNPAMIQTGLLTPAAEQDDPFAANVQSSTQQLPPSPPASVGSNSQPSCLDSILAIESAIDAEFHDGFVTQLYNYLSIGYPALARKYDHELSKITRIPVEKLRQDDASVNAKGYVGAPEGTGCDLRGVQEGQCERWTALRLYVREWARQQPRMGPGRDGLGVGEDWGARARKGSWAI